MATLTIIQHRSKLMPLLPHKVLINGQPLGILQTEQTQINMPAGSYHITIQSMLPMLSSSRTIHVDDNLHNILRFKDRERWWDILFGIDLILWFVHLFVSLPPRWDMAYEIFTNGYFILWLIYEFIIHKKYFLLEFYQSPMPHITQQEK